MYIFTKDPFINRRDQNEQAHCQYNFRIHHIDDIDRDNLGLHLLY